MEDRREERKDKSRLPPPSLPLSAHPLYQGLDAIYNAGDRDCRRKKRHLSLRVERYDVLYQGTTVSEDGHEKLLINKVFNLIFKATPTQRFIRVGVFLSTFLEFFFFQYSSLPLSHQAP